MGDPFRSTRSQTYAVQERHCKTPERSESFAHVRTQKNRGCRISVNSPRSITSRISGRPLAAQHHPDCNAKIVFSLLFVSSWSNFLLHAHVFARACAPEKYGARIMHARYRARAPGRYYARIMHARYRARLDKLG